MSIFLEALQGKNSFQRPPVWLMRQAGRYMPSYRKLKDYYSLMEMFTQQDLIVEITLLPIKELQVDAAIIFSDILLPLKILGYKLNYEKGTGPSVEPKQFLFPKERFFREKMECEFLFLKESLKMLRKELVVPLIGFCGAPFTLASYILEPKDHHLMRETKKLYYQKPELFFSFLDCLCDLVIEYALFQVEAGAQVIQIFDSWSGVLDKSGFSKCSTHYLSKIVKTLKKKNIPVILFCRGSCLFVDELVKCDPTAISFDWHLPIHELACKVPGHIALQGNMDPEFLKAPFSTIEKMTLQYLESMRMEKRFIANLGHGVLPDLPYEAVKCFVDTVRNFSYQ